MATLRSPLRALGSTRPYQGNPYVFRKPLPIQLPLCVYKAQSESIGAVLEGHTSPSVADAWAVDVWSMPAAPSPTHTANVVFGMPPRLGELLTMQPDELHPANISTSTWTQHLQSQLVSRQAAKQLVQAIVLNGTYLPSQIDSLSNISSKLQLCTTCFISKQQLHVLVSQQPALQTSDNNRASAQQKHPELSWVSLLSSQLGVNIQPLPEDRMKAARDAEQLLRQQMRLYSPAVWSNALQQKLLTRRSVQTVIAVRSLMSPADLASVKKLVDKVGLHLLEVERELPTTESAANHGRHSSSSSSSSGSRRRIRQPSSLGSGSLTFDSSGKAACEKELVLVVSVYPFEAEDLAGLPDHIPPTAFSDYEPDSTAASKTKNSTNNRWWKLDIGKWFVRESQADQ